jgi:hypothetical protein
MMLPTGIDPTFRYRAKWDSRRSISMSEWRHAA